MTERQFIGWFSIERSAHPGGQPACYSGDDKDLPLHRLFLDQRIGIAVLGRVRLHDFAALPPDSNVEWNE